MDNKKYRGLVVVAPPHLNPENKANRYVFSGVEMPTGENFAHSFSVIPLPGTVTPERFAADVVTQNPLPGDLELFAPTFDLGKFCYFRPSTGKQESAQADDVTSLKPEQLQPSRQPEPEPDSCEPEPEFSSPEPEGHTPGLEF